MFSWFGEKDPQVKALIDIYKDLEKERETEKSQVKLLSLLKATKSTLHDFDKNKKTFSKGFLKLLDNLIIYVNSPSSKKCLCDNKEYYTIFLEFFESFIHQTDYAYNFSKIDHTMFFLLTCQNKTELYDEIADAILVSYIQQKIGVKNI